MSSFQKTARQATHLRNWTKCSGTGSHQLLGRFLCFQLIRAMKTYWISSIVKAMLIRLLIILDFVFLFCHSTGKCWTSTFFLWIFIFSRFLKDILGNHDTFDNMCLNNNFRFDVHWSKKSKAMRAYVRWESCPVFSRGGRGFLKRDASWQATYRIPKTYSYHPLETVIARGHCRGDAGGVYE